MVTQSSGSIILTDIIFLILYRICNNNNELQQKNRERKTTIPFKLLLIYDKIRKTIIYHKKAVYMNDKTCKNINSQNKKINNNCSKSCLNTVSRRRRQKPCLRSHLCFSRAIKSTSERERETGNSLLLTHTHGLSRVLFLVVVGVFPQKKKSQRESPFFKNFFFFFFRSVLNGAPLVHRLQKDALLHTHTNSS